MSAGWIGRATPRVRGAIAAPAAGFECRGAKRCADSGRFAAPAGAGGRMQALAAPRRAAQFECGLADRRASKDKAAEETAPAGGPR